MSKLSIRIGAIVMKMLPILIVVGYLLYGPLLRQFLPVNQEGTTQPKKAYITSEIAHKMIDEHLREKYNNEEFVIINIGQRSDGSISARIKPKSNIGTTREYDSYYQAEATIRDGKAGDNYSKVVFSENINNHYKVKLEKLFGKNVLPIFDFEITFNMMTYERMKKELGPPRLDGAIYIFGSIKNENDIKKYQKGIFDFVQYLKNQGDFEYAKIGFIVIDERVLEDDFEDLNIKRQLIEAKKNSETEKEFLTKRDKIMSQIKITNKDKSDRIVGIDRGELRSRGSAKYFGYTVIAGTSVISTKMIESDILYQKMYKSEIGKTYNKEEEISLSIFTSNYLIRRD